MPTAGPASSPGKPKYICLIRIITHATGKSVNKEILVELATNRDASTAKKFSMSQIPLKYTSYMKDSSKGKLLQTFDLAVTLTHILHVGYNDNFFYPSGIPSVCLSVHPRFSLARGVQSL